jgi:hypothetical protein
MLLPDMVVQLTERPHANIAIRTILFAGFILRGSIVATRSRHPAQYAFVDHRRPLDRCGPRPPSPASGFHLIRELRDTPRGTIDSDVVSRAAWRGVAPRHPLVSHVALFGREIIAPSCPSTDRRRLTVDPIASLTSFGWRK